MSMGNIVCSFKYFEQRIMLACVKMIKLYKRCKFSIIVLSTNVPYFLITIYCRYSLINTYEVPIFETPLSKQ